MSDESKAIEETAKAGQEIAKTARKAIDAGEKLGQFVARITSGSLEQAFGIIEDKLKYARWERSVRLMQRAEALMREIGLDGPSRPIPLKFAVPLLQGASLEDDDYLQDLWAKLLVNAADARSEVAIKRVFIEILENIGPLEAQILHTIYSIPFEKMQHNGVDTHDLPLTASILPEGLKSNPERPSPEVELALANLAHLDCLSITKTWKGGELFSRVNPTLLGKTFVEACTLRSQAHSEFGAQRKSESGLG